MSLPAPEQFKCGDHNSWCGIKVSIQNKGHGKRGQMGVVPNILVHQDTPSGLRVEVQFDVPEPGVTNGGATFNYNNLVEFEYIS